MFPMLFLTLYTLRQVGFRCNFKVHFIWRGPFPIHKGNFLSFNRFSDNFSIVSEARSAFTSTPPITLFILKFSNSYFFATWADVIISYISHILNINSVWSNSHRLKYQVFKPSRQRYLEFRELEILLWENISRFTWEYILELNPTHVLIAVNLSPFHPVFLSIGDSSTVIRKQW